MLKRIRPSQTLQHTHTHTSYRKPFVGCNCEVIEFGVRGVRGERSGVCCLRGLNQPSGRVMSHVCVCASVCLKIRILKPSSPLSKTQRSLFFAVYTETFPEHSPEHTHTSQFLQSLKKERTSVLQFGHHFILLRTSLG